jgi:hypothetical protein
MTNAGTGRAGHSSLGIASFVMSLVPGVLLVGIYWLVLFVLSKQHPDTDETGYAFGTFMLLLLTILSEIVALGLGVAGVFQRQRKRLFAFLGVALSAVVLAMINAEVRFANVAHFIAGFTETQPKVHVVSPGNE